MSWSIKKRTFRQVVRLYVSVCCTIFFLFLIGYGAFSFTLAQKQEQGQIENAALRCGTYLEELFGNISHLNFVLSNDEAAYRVSTGSAIQNYDYVLATQAVNKYSLSMNNIDSIYLYLDQPKIVLASDYGKCPSDEFYDRAFLESVEFPSSFQLQTRTVKNKDVLSVITRFPTSVGNPTYFQSYSCINLDLDTIERELSAGLKENQAIEVTINGQIQLRLGNLAANAENSYYSTESLRYHSGSVTVFSCQKEFIRSFLWKLFSECAVFFLLICAFSMMLTCGYLYFRRIAKPIALQLTALYRKKEQEPPLLSISDWEKTFQRLISDHRSYEQQLEESRRLFREKIHLQLFSGDIACEEELKQLCGAAEISLPRREYLVGAAALYREGGTLSAEELVLARVYVKSCLEKEAGERMYVHVTEDGRDRVGILIGFDDSVSAETLAYIREREQRISAELRASTGISCFFSLVYTVDHWNEIAKAYDQAKENLVYRVIYPDETEYAESLLEDVSDTLISRGELRSLNCAVRAGQLGQLESFLRQYSEQAETESEPVEFSKLKLCALCLIGLLWNQLPPSAEPSFWKEVELAVRQLENAESPETLFSKFSDVLTVCSRDRAIAAPAIETKNQYIKRAILFLNEHFQEECKISDIARHLNLNEKYLSRLFKQETNTTPGQYLASLRMEKAVSLLEKRECSIRAVSEQAGFHDPRSFTRLFKKTYGINPVEYQRQQTGGGTQNEFQNS